MKRFMVSCLVVLALSGVCFSQDSERAQIRPDIIVAPVKFSFDGERSFFKTPAIVGLAMDVNVFGLDITPGIYGAFEIDTSEDSDYNIGVVFNVNLVGLLGAGLFYDWYRSGDGVVGFSKDNTGFVFSLDISL